MTQKCACCGTGRWWSSYSEMFLSLGAIATLTSLAFLVAGWLMAWAGSFLSQFSYLAAAIVAGSPIAKSCLDDLLKKRISVEVLVTLAIGASLAIGEYHAAAVVAVMLLGGGMLEQLTIARARRALTSLLTKMPKTALVRRGEREEEVPISELSIGDRVIVRPGERVAVDGIVVAGEAAIDESPITGESIPVDKSVGAKVFAGSINLSGMLEVQGQKVGEETTLGRILQLVEKAQSSQAPIQRLVNKYAQWFVPMALIIAATVWAMTGDIVRSITVLIVLCPCALVLATPTAIIASMANAARRVILVKTGEFMEAVGQVEIVAFDKTGTLTVGSPQVTKVVPLNGGEPTELLRLAASVERFSEHPLGQAIRRAAEEQQISLLKPSQFRAFPGQGVEARLNGNRVLVGRLSWLSEKGVTFSSEAQWNVTELETSGQTVLPVAVNDIVIGLIAIRDVLRPEAKRAVAQLKAQKIRVVMLTGDNERVAKAIAAEAGIEEVHANLLPEEKLELVRKGQEEGMVAFVGDGINDAPALATADIGVAMGVAGTDVALETADIAFMNDDLTKMPELITLSRRTLCVIRQNIWFSVIVNIIAIIAASKGWISPVFGAFIHEGSAMAVILNAMRLLR